MAKNNRRFDNGEIDFLLGDVAISDFESRQETPEMEDGRDIAPFKKLPTWQTIGWGIECNPLESYFPGFLQAVFGSCPVCQGDYASWLCQRGQRHGRGGETFDSHPLEVGLWQERQGLSLLLCCFGILPPCHVAIFLTASPAAS